jgi:hypothetical protein
MEVPVMVAPKTSKSQVGADLSGGWENCPDVLCSMLDLKYTNSDQPIVWCGGTLIRSQLYCIQ